MDDVELDKGEPLSEENEATEKTFINDVSDPTVQTSSGGTFDISGDTIVPSNDQEPTVEKASVFRPTSKIAPTQPVVAAPITPKPSTPSVVPKQTFQKIPQFVGGMGAMNNFSKDKEFKQPEAAKAPINIPIGRKPIAGFRSYSGDVASAMSTKNISATTIALAENKRRVEEGTMMQDAQPSHTVRNLIISLISLILLGGGVFGAYTLYLKSALAPVAVAPQQQTQIALVPTDSQTTITIDGLNALEVQNRIRKVVALDMPANTIKEIVPLVSSDGKKMRVAAGDMLALMDTGAPNILARSLTPVWMLGIYSDKDKNKSIFVIITTNFFQNAFAGMLQWEKYMADDIRQYLYAQAPRGVDNSEGNIVTTSTLGLNPLDNINSILPPSVKNTIPIKNTDLATTSKQSTASTTTTTRTGTSTATTTLDAALEKVEPYPTITGSFQDIIIKNRDARAFRTIDSKTLFLYSFINNSKLVIAANEATLDEILTRLEKQAFIR